MKYNLLDAFFAKRKRGIIVNGGELEVYKSKGGQDIYLDVWGRFILGRWQPKAEPKATPRQRAREPWRPEEKKYSIYGKGLLSAWRGRQLAMFAAWQKRLPMFNIVLRLIQEETRGKIQQGKVEKFLTQLKIKLWRIGFLLLKSPKPEIGEAKTKILFLYRDIEGGLNIGALLAETVAITDRLMERLQGIYGWLAVYSSQSRFLDFLQARVDEVFSRVEKTLKIMRRHPVFNGGSVTKGQLSSLANKIEIVESDLENLRPFLPYRPWVEMAVSDLKQMSETLKKKEFSPLCLPLERIMVSFEIKRQQREMDRFLLKLGKDQILSNWNGDNYRCWLIRRMDDFEALKKVETRVVFREPVCAAVIAFLSQAKEMVFLRNFGSFAKLHRAVSQAYVLL